MTQDHELKPCPFCGSKAKIHTAWGKDYDVVCLGDCPSIICGMPTKATALKVWNTRASERRLDFHKIADVIHENAKSFFQVDGQKEVWTETPSFKTAKEIMDAYNEGKLWEEK